jgi:hypothetical protein
MKAPTSRAALAAIGIAMALAALPVLPALADHEGQNERAHYNDRNDRGRSDDRRGHEAHRRYPVYAPAPVYYPRHESPGISLFFPIH